MSATRAAPVARVFARSATATLPPARRSPIMPEPTTAASNSAVPTLSAVTRRASVNCCVVVTATTTSVAGLHCARDRDVRSRLHGRWDVNKQRVLFLCTHNSARSQMAEGLLRSLAGDRFDVASAGTEATRMHPLAIRAMADVGIDLSRHTSKSVETLLDQPWDHVITVCDSANERCPIFPKPTHRLHWSFPDPSQARGTTGDRLNVFRRVRDEIAARLEAWLETMAAATRGGGSTVEVVSLADKFVKYSDARAPRIVGEANAIHARASRTRLEVFFFLVRARREVPAGEIQAELEIPGPTLSHHLDRLRRAGLVQSRKEERFMYYSTRPEMVSELVRLLTACC